MPDMNDWIRKYLKDVPAKEILDIGGKPEPLKGWRSLYPAARFTVLNINRGDLPRKSANVTPVLGDAQKMRFANATFDLVVSNQVLEHIDRPEECLKETLRVLKPNGVALFTTPNLAAWYNRLGLLFGYQPFNYTPSPGFRNLGFPKWIKKNNIYDHPRVFTYKALLELFNLVGFRVEKWDVVNHTYQNQPYRRVREFAHYFIPRGWRENIIIRARKP